MGLAALYLAPWALSLAVALLVGRWWVLVVPLVSVPLLYVGLRYGWWGGGVGDGWQVLAAALTAAAVAASAAIVGAARLWHARRAG